MQKTIQAQETLDLDKIQTLQAELCARSKGVFLWIRLILDELLTEYSNGVSLDDLLALLETFPQELERYYDFMIRYCTTTHLFLASLKKLADHVDYLSKRINDRYKDGRNVMMSIIRCSDNVSAVEFFNAYHVARADAVDGFKVPRISVDEARRLIYSRCGALVELQLKPDVENHSESGPSLEDFFVQFLHQTVKSWVDKNFDTAKGYCFLIKSMVRFSHGPLEILRTVNFSEKDILVFGERVRAAEGSIGIDFFEDVKHVKSIDVDFQMWTLSEIAVLTGAPKLYMMMTEQKNDHLSFRDYCKRFERSGFLAYHDLQVPRLILERTLS
ncbi:hypothetical protein EJ04DRAFT_560355 [Polyplosphaeria fusca]|uniref:Uncharacterized protein n=1 Tax=Polyplosphaeria fusca TaxID=682080 RepID=A0A9P4V3M7_9PLEO|nr:hypothetical protein EJ04DRAFT_560355 [Polyplosphaeria fusca]